MAGSFEHVIDAKGRLTLPAKLRDQIGNTVHITNSSNGLCLYAFSDEEWDNFCRNLLDTDFETATVLEHYFIANAFDCELDSQGRILIPQNLRTKMDLQKNVTVLSLTKRLEIWNTDRWNEFDNNIQPNDIMAMMKNANIRV